MMISPRQKAYVLASRITGSRYLDQNMKMVDAIIEQAKAEMRAEMETAINNYIASLTTAAQLEAANES